jgi:uncharacterized protein (DUF1330 family)
MPKGYWVARIDVSDPEGYKLYMAEVVNAFRRYGGRYLMRGGRSERLEGEGRARVVVIEFKDYATALECHRSAEYAKARALRTGKALDDIIVTEGYEGPQPTDG